MGHSTLQAIMETTSILVPLMSILLNYTHYNLMINIAMQLDPNKEGCGTLYIPKCPMA